MPAKAGISLFQAQLLSSRQQGQCKLWAPELGFLVLGTKMRFGIHTHLVDEIIEYARDSEIFVHHAHSPILGSCAIEPDFVAAQERARTQDPEDDYAIWADLCSLEMSKVRGLRTSVPGFDAVSLELPKLGDEFSVIFKTRLGHGPYDAIRDKVASDFYHFAYKRAVLGDVPHFFETLLDIYRAGGWPCGWKGSYPAGRLVVYVPA